MSFNLYKCIRHYLPAIFLIAFVFSDVYKSRAQYNFTPSSLSGAALDNPTSIQFGPDGRLYVSQQNGIIKVFTVQRNGSNSYSVTATQTINVINLIPNHDDDGALNSAVTTRQVTGILVKGTAANPIIYVSSSDSRIGGSSHGDINLDTNSGIISLLSWNGSAWTKLDLVRGLPRSEENHSNNGLQLDTINNTLFVAVGGHTNAGSPSTNFAYSCEYALSAAILSIDLTAINAISTKGSGNTAYKYDLPTVDDPNRTNNPDGSDINDPYGGDNGLNQAKIVSGGPVQVYASGFRNSYDLVITQARRMYTIDNGANQGWGGYPKNEGTSNVTNEYVSGEPGSTTGTANEGVVNNLDNFHFVGNIDTYVSGSFYGGHPNAIRANPVGAGLYTYNGTTGVWRNSKTGPNPLPTDWPSVPFANPVEGDFQMPGVNDLALLTFNSSTNGLSEYTASNFNNALKGALLACSFDGSIYKITLTADGANVTNAKSSSNKLNQDVPFASGFGAQPLDITCQGDNVVFPGTVWVAGYGSNAITIFEPQDFVTCTGLYNSSDDDHDNYTNADEVDNGTNPCSAATVPPDFDHDFISDLNDSDDDNDGIPDNADPFAIDAQNGLGTNLPIRYELLNNNPGTGLFGLGSTGLMTNNNSDYLTLYNGQNLIAGGAEGALTIVSVSQGDALGSLNNQENGFQFGVKSMPGAGPFTIEVRMLGPFFNSKTPQGFQSQGIYIGTGDQDNYLKITLNANQGLGGIEVVNENAGVPTSYQFQLAGGIPNSTLDLFLAVDPNSGSVQPKYKSDGGTEIVLGSPIQLSGALLNVLQGNTAFGLGVISTSRGATPFTATWDYIYVTNDAITATGSWQTIIPATGIDTAREENAYVQAGDKFYLMGGRKIKPVQAYDPVNKSWTNKALPPVEINHFQAVTLNGLVYAAGAFTGAYPHETPVPTIYIFDPVTNKWLNGPTIPLARRRGSPGAALYKNKIYLVGGITDGHWSGWVNWFDEFDPATNTWKALPNAPRARDHFHVTIINDKLYAVGGRRSSGITGQVFELTVPEVDVYDFNTGQWSTLASSSNIPTPRAGAATALLGNEVIVIGGEDAGTAAHKTTEALDVNTNTWRRIADLQQGRHGTQAIVNNGGIYVAAGAGTQGGGMLLNSQEVFNLFGPTTPGGSAISQSQLTAPASVAFGSVPINYDSVKTITLTNTEGNQDILISSMTINGAASFTVNAPFTMPFILPVGKVIPVTIKFKPTTSEAQTATLVINHSGQGSSVSVAISGQEFTPAYRINAGGGQITNSIGTFNADAYYSPTPGYTYSNSSAISGTGDDAIYQTERSATTNNGTFDYAFPVSNGQYTVILHFAELYFTASGKRVFDVSIEGTKVLDNYDIFKKVGALAATTETFSVGVADGTLNIHFSASTSDGGINRPKISAIEILKTTVTTTYYRDADGDGYGNPQITTTGTSQPAGYVTNNQDCDDSDATIKPGAVEVCDDGKDNNCNGQIDENCSTTPDYRINAGGGQITNSIGTFNADAYYSPTPGYTYSNTSAISGTGDDAIYQTERSATTNNGTFDYAFPVSNGQYTVILHFAELYFTASGKRVFDVSIEGTKVLNNYDIFKKVGALTATTETFNVSVADGTLNIHFSASTSDGGTNRPKISAIEILKTNVTTTYYRDADGDGYGNPQITTTGTSQPAGYVTNNQDCDDSDATIKPGAVEVCDDGKDNNCNGQIDENCITYTYYSDSDGDGYGKTNSPITSSSATPPAGYAALAGDCNDTNASVHPGATEVCNNGVDDDCDGNIDEGCTVTYTYYFDGDGDGYGKTNSPITSTSATPPSGYAALDGDCNDANASIHPGATEVCNNGVDDDCDGNIDENCSVTPGLSINDLSVYESQGSAVLTVTLSKTSTTTVSVNYKTVNGTATNPKDYKSVKGTLSIPANTLSSTITVPILTDRTTESQENFSVTLSNPRNATIVDGDGVVTILDGTTPLITMSKQSVIQNDLINEPESKKFSVKVYSNPSNSYFKVIVQSTDSKPVTLEITDLTGRIIQSFKNLMTNRSLILGSDYVPGIYFMKAKSGKDKVTVKLIKAS
jgi:N-acetylneuraminic acid mutarotase